MSTIKVDTLDTRTGTGNITVSRPLSGLSGSGASYSINKSVKDKYPKE